jgi:hypothetical protein
VAIIVFQRQQKKHVFVVRLFLVFNFPVGVAEKSTTIETVKLDWLMVKIYNAKSHKKRRLGNGQFALTK